MPAPYSATADGIVVYTFGSLDTFNRIVDDEYVRWFGKRLEYTQDLALDTEEDYFDIGATAFETLAIRGEFSGEGASEDAENAVGTTATLSNTRGRSSTVTLIAAQAVEMGVDNMYVVDMTFVRRPLA